MKCSWKKFKSILQFAWCISIFVLLLQLSRQPTLLVWLQTFACGIKFDLESCILDNPIGVGGDTGVDARMIRFAAANAPGNDANGDPASIGQLHEQWTARIALAWVSSTVWSASTQHFIGNTFDKRWFAFRLRPNRQRHFHENVRRWSTEILRAPAGDNGHVSFVCFVHWWHTYRPNVGIEQCWLLQFQHRNVIIVCGRIEINMLANLANAKVARTRVISRTETVFAEAHRNLARLVGVCAMSGSEDVSIGD